VAIRATAARAVASALEEPLLFRTPTPPVLPGHIPLEASVPCSDPFDDHDWLFSIDWDGARALLFLDPDSPTRVQGETLGELGRRFPDVAGTVVAPAGRAAVLDGVIAVLDAQGRPDLTALGRRLAAGPALAAELPAVYLAFDVLHLDGRPITGWALERRVAALSAFAGSGDVLQVPDHVRGRGIALAAAATARGLPALLARRARAPYRPGLASPDRLRIPIAQQTTCVIAGIVERRRGAPRLILGEQVAGHLVFAGQVEGPRDKVVSRWLAQHVATLTVGTAMLDGVQPLDANWLRPALTATVRHHGRGAGGALLRPSLVAVRDDVEPRWCVRRPSVAAPADVAAGFGFAPTLIVPLPLGDTSLLPRPRT
jgi:bifunctional non-homologous end joining protein LigD